MAIYVREDYGWKISVSDKRQNPVFTQFRIKYNLLIYLSARTVTELRDKQFGIADLAPLPPPLNTGTCFPIQYRFLINPPGRTIAIFM